VFEGVANSVYIDFEFYRWLVVNTEPRDLFVTDLPDNYSDSAAQSIFTAGRHLVAVNYINSNPYLDGSGTGVVFHIIALRSGRRMHLRTISADSLLRLARTLRLMLSFLTTFNR
jgi:hypothetical protein